MDALQLRDNARQQLAQIKDIETGTEYLNKVKAIEVWAKAEKKDAELQNAIAEQKIRTQRILGRLLDENEVRKSGHGNFNTGVKKLDSSKKHLSDYGISKYESSNFQKIASIPEDIFEQEIASAKQESERKVELTTSRVLRAAKQYERQKIHQELSKNNSEIDTSKKYRVIYADPPWKYGDTAMDRTGGAETYYPTMSINELSDMPIKEISEDNAVLFLWVTSPLLEESFDVIKAWGFKYKTSFVWDKIKHNMGHYNSVRHEFLLVCTKGSCTPDVKKLYDSVQSIERTEHSKKPEEFREIIDTIYTHGNRIELFARLKSKGWDVYGNQSL